ncbi:MAG: hypothetical protein IJN43_16225 [Ruminococcus sp.]|nr:hypothetical protein [Oscillospiraceae bacterium]MBQ6945846.1 hypothetical protein [Ruminococcus sp.]
MNIFFFNEEHMTAYSKLLSIMQHRDCYHQSLAYLLTLDSVCREHLNDLFDIEEDLIKRNGLHCSWQTGTSKKTTRLAFNLWNGCHTDGETYNKDGYETELPSRYYAVDEIFNCCSYAPYYWQAVRLRYQL